MLLVTIDGPAGSGKSTVARVLSRRLRLPYIDTGAMYRSLTWMAIKARVPWKNHRALTRLAGGLRIQFKPSKGYGIRVIANGQDVSKAIRTPELTREVHRVAAIPSVRAKMVHLQRGVGRLQGGVLEGRDIGTVVFPGADAKVYLDADFQ